MDGASAPSNPSTMQGNLPSNLDRYLDSLSAPQYSGSIPPFVAGDNVDDAFASFWTNFDCNLPAAPLEEGGSEDLHTMLNRIWDAPSASSLNSYATMQSDASLVPTGNIQFSQLAPSAPGTTVPVNLTKENLHMYFPAWASIYKDIATIATSMMLVEEAVIWLPGESSGQRRLSEDQLIIHPLYKIAHRAHQIKLRYHRSLVENPPSSDGFSLAELIARWITADLMKIRNGITNGATDTAYNYGFRNLPHDDANDEQLEANTSSAMVPEMTRKGRLRNIVVESGVTPAAGMGPKLPHVIPRECSTQAEQQKNLKVYEDTDRDNAFLHIWQIVHQIRPDYGEIVGPYLNSNITDLVKQSFYVGDDCIAARTDELGKRDPQLRAAFPHLFVWHLELPLQAYLVVAASVKFVIHSWRKGGYHKTRWVKSLLDFFCDLHSKLKQTYKFDVVRRCLGTRYFSASQIGNQQTASEQDSD